MDVCLDLFYSFAGMRSYLMTHILHCYDHFRTFTKGK